MIKTIESNDDGVFEIDFKELLEKHVPQASANLIRDKFNELIKIQDENKQLKENLRIVKESNYKLENNYKEIQEKNILLEKNDYLVKTREEAVAVKERQLELREIRVLNEITKADMAQRHSEDFKNVLTSVFSNKTVFESVMETQGGTWNWDSQKNMNVFSPDGTKNISKTKNES